MFCKVGLSVFGDFGTVFLFLQSVLASVCEKDVIRKVISRAQVHKFVGYLEVLITKGKVLADTSMNLVCGYYHQFSVPLYPS